MDLGLNRRRRQQKAIISDDLKDLYPHDISLYTIPPSNDITLGEFEDLALERLKVLRIIDYATNKGLKMFSTEWKDYIYDQLNKENLRKYLRLIKSTGINNPKELDLQARRADHYSHWILRLAYCRSDELRRWFLNKEIDLFKMRFMELSPPSVAQFMKLNKLQYTPISEDEKMALRDELSESTAGFFVLDTTTFFKVPFMEVPDLVKNRKVLIVKGFAYVPIFEISSCILTLFRSSLNESLAYACKRIPYMDDTRINYILSNLHSTYTGADFSEASNSVDINLSNLSNFSKVHFPLCMRHIHDLLRSTNHLKHGCRLQYLLFLKGIGLLFEDCMQYWRDEFTKKIDGDKFDKQYSYAVKHVYGKVGSMTNYSPFSCMKIISTSVGPGDQHGCPFKNWDSPCLKQKLNEFGVSAKGVAEIAEIAEKGHYQIACGKYFDHTHKVENPNVILHPNKYFEDSYALMTESQPQTSSSTT